MISPADSSPDLMYMQRALNLAIRGFADTGKNPMVGAVIVYEHRIIGEGYHERYGDKHAEINALESVCQADKHLIQGSTMYVTLEPCSHTGKTPPCANRIVKEGIRRVVVGTSDPNPIVTGKGMGYLRANGLLVEISELQEACDKLLIKFKANLDGIPYIQLKWAQSRNGYIGISGKNIWLSNGFTRILTHRDRNMFDGILIGKGTAMTDNPVLDDRYFDFGKPVRILMDSNLELPSSYRLFDGSAPTWIINKIKNDDSGNPRYIQFDSCNLKGMLQLLYRSGITSLIIEGGAKVLQSFAEAGMWHVAMVIRTKKKLEDGLKAPLIQGVMKDRFQLAEDEVLIIENERFTNEN